jgi:hypothetical protein
MVSEDHAASIFRVEISHRLRMFENFVLRKQDGSVRGELNGRTEEAT